MPLHRDQTYQMGAGFGVVGSVRLAMYLFTHLLLVPIYPFNNWFVRLITYIFIYLSIHLLLVYLYIYLLFTYSVIRLFIYIFH